jgi:hypothetical protein
VISFSFGNETLRINKEAGRDAGKDEGKALIRTFDDTLSAEDVAYI